MNGHSTSSAFDSWDKDDLPPLSATIHRTLTAEEIESFDVPNSVTLRNVTGSDLKEIRALHAEWFPVSYNEDFYKSISSGEYLTIVASLTGDPSRIVGLITVAVNRNESQFNHSGELLEFLGHSSDKDTIAYILTLGVVDELRGKGLAKALLEKAMVQVRCSDENCKVVFLHVIQYNMPAMRLYEKCGFKNFKIEPSFYRIGDDWYSGILSYRIIERNQEETGIRKIVWWIKNKLSDFFHSLFTTKRQRKQYSYLETV